MEYREQQVWLSHLERTANFWQTKFGLDPEESYSELLVQFAIALDKYEEDKGVKFDTFFFYYKRKALNNLTEERDRWQGKTDDGHYMDTVEDEVLNSVGYDIGIVRQIIFNVDAMKLDSDTRFVLQYILDNGLKTDKSSRLGKNTVVNNIVDAYNWSIRRARTAVENLGRFYMECVCA